MLVKACLNGGTSRAEHLAVPQLPDELAADAVATVRAGAGAVHVHPRDASGAEVLDAACVLAAVGSIHAAIPGVPAGVTTGLWAAGGDPEKRLALVSGWTGPDRPEFASVNMSEPGAATVETALDRHVFTAPRLHHGYGVATWHVLRAAVAMGRDIRVGLEDTVVLADGTLAMGNAELVGAAVALAVG
jgi:uncharacterized protein (DUF849 family)